jgi:hypothetical protein
MAAMAPPAYLHGIAVSMYGRFGHGLFAESGVCNARLVAQSDPNCPSPHSSDLTFRSR